MIEPLKKALWKNKKKKQKKSKNADSSISFHQRKCQGGRKSIPKANLIIFENRSRGYEICMYLLPVTKGTKEQNFLFLTFPQSLFLRIESITAVLVFFKICKSAMLSYCISKIRYDIMVLHP